MKVDNVKTRRMLPNDLASEEYRCEFCHHPAHYWSQVELSGGKNGSRVVHHCQRCRDEGRLHVHAPLLYWLVNFGNGEIVEAELSLIVDMLLDLDDDPTFAHPHLLMPVWQVYNPELKQKAWEVFWERQWTQ